MLPEIFHLISVKLCDKAVLNFDHVTLNGLVCFSVCVYPFKTKCGLVLKWKMISLTSLALYCCIFINSSHQKKQKESNFGTCERDCFASFADPAEMLDNLKNAKNTVIKDVMFGTIKEAFAKMKDMPQAMADKINNEEFLKKAIETVINQKDPQTNETSKSVPKSQEKATDFVYEKKPFRPYKGQVRLEDWHDFYHYFPHLANPVRLWKLEFKDSARRNWKKFKGCANPGRLVDWLVPDIEEVKTSKRKAKFMSREERQKDF